MAPEILDFPHEHDEKAGSVSVRTDGLTNHSNHSRHLGDSMRFMTWWGKSCYFQLFSSLRGLFIRALLESVELPRKPLWALPRKRRRDLTHEVDWGALGVLTFELLCLGEWKE